MYGKIQDHTKEKRNYVFEHFYKHDYCSGGDDEGMVKTPPIRQFPVKT